MATTKKRGAKKPAAKKVVSKKKPAATKKRVARSATKARTAKKPAPVRTPAAAKPKVKRTPSAAFMNPMTPSEVLARIVGATPLPRTEVVRKMWQYIKQNQLQDSVNKRLINADEKLKEIFGKAQVSIFEMSKYINQHLT